jgi:flagellar biosynthesis protein FliQ
MSAVLGRRKLPPVDVIDTGIGMILAMVEPLGVGVGLGVGVFVGLGAAASLAEACMAFAASIIKTRVETRKARKTIFVCIVVPHLSKWMGSRIMHK